MNKGKEILPSILVLGCFVFIFYIIQNIRIDRMFYFIFGYMMIVSIFVYINSKTRSKYVKLLCLVIIWPFIVIIGSLKFSIPIIAIILYLFFYEIIVSIPILSMNKINEFHEICSMTKETKIFLFLTYFSIISVVFNKQLIRLINKLFSIWWKYDSSESEMSRIKEMAEYIISPQNLRFLIYSSYFIYLCIFSFNYLENISSFVNKSVYTAIMQSFITFLAFDSLRTNSTEVKFLPSILLDKLLNNFFIEIKGFGEKEKEKKKENSI